MEITRLIQIAAILLAANFQEFFDPQEFVLAGIEDHGFLVFWVRNERVEITYKNGMVSVWARGDQLASVVA